MSSAQHLILPYAHAPGLAVGSVAGQLPTLRRLLARLQPSPLQAGDAQDLSPPHERALAQALGLPVADGVIPWAAWEQAQSGQAPGDEAWAWITPCHWHVARDHILMHPVDTLQLDEPASRTLLAAIAPYFHEDGIALDFVAPTRWRARGAVFRDLACASLDRVTGRRVDDWLPRAAAARPLRRLQQEMQMLLYTHPVNAEREAAGLSPVNSFWVSGAGALDARSAKRSPVQVDERLRPAALAGLADDWAAQWRALDTQVLPGLLAALDAQHPVALTLCGERHARTWATPSPRGWQRAIRLLRPPSVAQALEEL
jgi:hypothetical protein